MKLLAINAANADHLATAGIILNADPTIAVMDIEAGYGEDAPSIAALVTAIGTYYGANDVTELILLNNADIDEDVTEALTDGIDPEDVEEIDSDMTDNLVVKAWEDRYTGKNMPYAVYLMANQDLTEAQEDEKANLDKYALTYMADFSTDAFEKWKQLIDNNLKNTYRSINTAGILDAQQDMDFFRKTIQPLGQAMTDYAAAIA